jgi:hypothetical protein
MLDFPTSPTNNQIFNAPNGTVWIWDGAKWTSGSTGGGFLPLAGGTMTGELTLASDPVNALDASTKEYVDATNIRYRNRIINGDMSVDQRNGGTIIAAPATTGGYIIDRWKFGTNIASKGNVGQSPVGPPGQALTGGFQYFLAWTTTTAYTPAAADLLYWSHYVEGYNFNDAMWGTSNAQPVTLEFWATATVAGTYAAALRNVPATRSYVATFALPASVWTRVRLNIPSDTAGTWAVAANVAALTLNFNLGNGSNVATTPNAWQAGNFLTAAGVVNPVATLNAALNITGVALMVGAAAQNAEPEFRKYSDNLIDCQRYFQIYPNVLCAGYAPAGGTFYSDFTYQVTMRVAPTTVSLGTPAYGNASSMAVNGTIASHIRLSAVATATGIANATAGPLTLDADF